jgi:hypothetical protein
MFSIVNIMHRFAATLADDNLSLQHDLENVQSAIAELTLQCDQMRHDQQSMRVQLSRLGLDVSSVHVGQHAPSSRNESYSTEIMPSEVEQPKVNASCLQDRLISSQMRCESLCSLLSNFVPFEQSAVAVEHAASLIFERLQLSSNALVDRPDQPNRQSPLKFVDGTELSTASGFHSAEDAQQVSVVEVNDTEKLANIQIQRYQDLLSSFEDELNASWSRETDLHSQLQCMRAALSSRRANHHSASCNQPLSFCSFSTSPVDQHSFIKLSILRAHEILLETKIPASDAFVVDVFNLQADQLFPLLKQQITSHNECLVQLNRMMQSSVRQDRDSTYHCEWC